MHTHAHNKFPAGIYIFWHVRRKLQRDEKPLLSRKCSLIFVAQVSIVSCHNVINNNSGGNRIVRMNDAEAKKNTPTAFSSSSGTGYLELFLCLQRMMITHACIALLWDTLFFCYFLVLKQESRDTKEKLRRGLKKVHNGNASAEKKAFTLLPSSTFCANMCDITFGKK